MQLLLLILAFLVGIVLASKVDQRQAVQLTVTIFSSYDIESLKRVTGDLLLTKNPWKYKIDLVIDVDGAAASSHIAKYVQRLSWPHGGKKIQHSSAHDSRILKSWTPAHSQNFGVFFDDSSAISPLWLAWTRTVLLAIENGALDSVEGRLFGVALSNPQVLETTGEPFDSAALAQAVSGDPRYPFLLQAPSSAGALYFPKPWEKFIQYSKHRLVTKRSIQTPSGTVNQWSDDWKKFMYEYLWMKGHFVVYPNFNRMSLTAPRRALRSHAASLLTDEALLLQLKLSASIPFALVNPIGAPIISSFLMEKPTTASSFVPKLSSDNFIWAGEKDSLASGQVLHASKDDLLRSAKAVDGSYFQAGLSGGALAIERLGRDPSDVWSSNTRSKSSTRLYMSPTGVVFLFNVDYKTLWCSAPAGCSSYVNASMLEGSLQRSEMVSGSEASYPILKLESNGNLVVYTSADDHFKCVVKETELFSHFIHRETHELPMRCQSRHAESRSDKCESFPQSTNDFMSADEPGMTVLLSTFDRFMLLKKQIHYYSSSPLVSTILVTWHKIAVAPPPVSFLNNTMIYFIQPGTDSLNNRFLPSVLATTDAVLIIDDDIKVSIDDLHLLYAVWSKYPRNMVGFFPRWIQHADNDRVEYLFMSSADAEDYGGYAFVLTKVMMIHRSLLYQYSCDAEIAEWHKTVDENMNCEDIFMNGVAGLHSDGAILKGSPALYVPPLNRIGDFGRAAVGSGLFKRLGHVEFRSLCAQMVNDLYIKKRNTLWPIQSNVVQRQISGNKIELWTEALQNVRSFHSDCFKLFGNAECNFIAGTGDSRYEFYWR